MEKKFQALIAKLIDISFTFSNLLKPIKSFQNFANLFSTGDTCSLAEKSQHNLFRCQQ